MSRPGKHIHRSNAPDGVTVLDKGAQVACEGGRVTGHIDDMRRKQCFDFLNQLGRATLTRRIQDHDGRTGNIEPYVVEPFSRLNKNPCIGDVVHLRIVPGVFYSLFIDLYADNFPNPVRQHFFDTPVECVGLSSIDLKKGINGDTKYTIANSLRYLCLVHLKQKLLLAERVFNVFIKTFIPTPYPVRILYCIRQLPGLCTRAHDQTVGFPMLINKDLRKHVEKPLLSLPRPVDSGMCYRTRFMQNDLMTARCIQPEAHRVFRRFHVSVVVHVIAVLYRISGDKHGSHPLKDHISGNFPDTRQTVAHMTRFLFGKSRVAQFLYGTSTAFPEDRTKWRHALRTGTWYIYNPNLWNFTPVVVQRRNR